MRLWHYRLLPALPRSQLLAQWRELNSIFVKEDKHILINYIYDNDPEALLTYSWEVIRQLVARRYKYNTSNMEVFFSKYNIDIYHTYRPKYFIEHNRRYLRQCFYNLQEKYDRGQKDFDNDTYEKIVDLCKEVII